MATPAPTPAGMRRLHVMIGAGRRHELLQPTAMTMHALKAWLAAHELRDVAPHGRMRLIYHGRLLRDSDTVSVVAEGACVHVVVSEPPTSSGSSVAPTRVSDGREVGDPRRRSAMGDPPAPGPMAAGGPGVAARAHAGDDASHGEEGSADLAAPSHAVGFDRLAEMGLRGEDVDVLRGLYTNDVVATMGPTMPRLEGETELDRLHRMEEAWMSRQGPESEFMVNVRPLLMQRHARLFSRLSALQSALAAVRPRDGVDDGGDGRARPRPGVAGDGDEEGGDWSGDGQRGDGDDHDPANAGTLSAFLCAFSLSVIIGPLMLLWLFQPSFSRKFRLGLIMGVVANVMLQVAVGLMNREGDDGTSTIDPGAGGGTSGGGRTWSGWPLDASTSGLVRLGARRR